MLAIKTRHCDVFVSAAAGSGKTKVMTERFVEAVRDDGIPVNRILTITFTNEAAAQLQGKIAARLAQEGLIEEARGVPDAYIGTIHSFCSRVLRAHSFTAGIDPNFIMLEDVRAKAIIEDSIDLASVEFAGRGERHLDFISQIGKKNLSQTVISLHEALRSAGFIDPTAGFPEFLCDKSAMPDTDTLFKQLRQKLESIIGKEGRDAGPKTYTANFEVAEGLLGHLDIFGHDTRPGLSERFKFNTQANVSKAVFGEVKELLKIIDDSIAVGMAQLYHGFYAELLEIFSRVYREQKAGVSGLDFEDLQLLTKRLFENHPGIRDGYKSRFKQIMVDEFQDTNRLQCDLINLIASNNVFTVGDENQSIYRFRHADVSVFRDLRASVEAKAAGLSIKLPQNYRSREELISFVNRVGKAFGLFNEGNLPLVPGRRHGFMCSGGPAVEFAIVEEKRNTADPAYVEALHIARRVSELLNEGKYKAGDIAVLIPKRTKLKVIEAALQDFGVDYYTISGSGYYSITEVAEIRDLLAVMVNPYDDAALIGVLRGPCVRLSDDALVLIRKAASKAAPDTPLWEAVKSGQLELPGKDNEKLTRFLSILAELRRYATQGGLSAIIEQAAAATGYDLACLMRDQKGTLRYANIRKLMELADSYEEGYGPKLAGFAEHLAKQKELSGQEGEATLADEEAGAVRIMTVHAAKGLQFPVVFLALSKGKPIYNSPGSSEMVVFSGKKSAFKVAGLNRAYEAPGYSELKGILRQEADAEDKRLIHVALTRAEERLFITGICDIDKDLKKSETNTYIEWLMGALDLKHGELRSQRDKGNCSWNDGGVDLSLIIPELILLDGASIGQRQGVAEDILPPNIDPAWLAPVNPARSVYVRELSYTALEDFIACARRFRLRYIEATKLKPQSFGSSPSKASINGSISTSDAGAGSRLDAASLGTLVHELMQSIDMFSGAEVALDMVRRRHPNLALSDRQRIETIVRSFSNSAIAKRLAKAQDIQKETPFAYEVADTVLFGRLDVLTYDTTQALIVDYKTGKISEDLPGLLQKYKLQMEVYALALLKSGAPSVEVVIVGLENDSEAVSRLYGSSDMAELQEKIAVIIEDIKSPAQGWPATADRGFCRLCEFALICGR